MVRPGSRSPAGRSVRGRRGLLAGAVAVLLVVAAVLVLRGRAGPGPLDPSAALVPAGPVLLVPGHGGDTAPLAALAAALGATGRQVELVAIGDGSGDIAAYGRSVADRAAALVAGGAPGVDLVGYSEGGLISRAAVGIDPRHVRRLVTIASPHAGTTIATLGARLNSGACDTACRQMAEGSDLLASLPPVGDASRTASLFSRTDDVIRPAESAALPGSTQVDLTALCPATRWDHGTAVTDAASVAVVVTYLETGRPPTSCPA